MTNNNISRKKCSEIAEANNWKKETYRNVVTVNGQKWSFSMYSNRPECRQTYEDTVGFIGLSSCGNLSKYKVNDFTKYSVSRISPSGIKSYNIKVKTEEMIPL